MHLHAICRSISRSVSRSLFPLLAVLALAAPACSAVEDQEPAPEPALAEPAAAAAANGCFRDDPATFAAAEEAALRAQLAKPQHPACLGSTRDGRAVCDVKVDAFVDENGHAVKVSTSIIRGVDERGQYAEMTASCRLSCTGSACDMVGCNSDGGDNCSNFNCGAGCTGTCTKTGGDKPPAEEPGNS